MAERLLIYRKYLSIPRGYIEELENQLKIGNIEQVRYLCSAQENFIHIVISKGINQRQATAKNVEVFLENESKRALSMLEENLFYLATVSGVAPMIGFLGTVTGMVQTFMAISQEKTQLSSQIFSHGIYAAMITTVAGLIVGITAYISYNYFIARVNKAAGKLEYLVNLFLYEFKFK